MLHMDSLTSVSFDLACQLLPKPFFARQRRKNARRKMALLRRRARLELSLLEDRTLLSASISGNVWNDLNGSGVRVVGDPSVAGQTVYLDLNNDHKFDSTQTTLAAGSTSFGPSPGELGSFGFSASTLQVQSVSQTIQDVAVSMNVTNNSPDPIQVSLVSPLGLPVPQLPTMITLQGGQTFDGTLDDNAPNSINLASGSQSSGTYSPEQILSNPQ